MTDKEWYDKALCFTEQKHRGQYRIGGDPYIVHPVAVAELLREKGMGIDYQIAGLFHDLLEDTDATEEEIEALGNPSILRAVQLLTKEKGTEMAEYVKRIRNDSMAFAVKGADRLHNLRCALVTNDEFKRKYILETLDWYLDFDPEIPKAVKALAQSLQVPLHELSFLYEPIETWRIGRKG